MLEPWVNWQGCLSCSLSLHTWLVLLDDLVSWSDVFTWKPGSPGDQHRNSQSLQRQAWPRHSVISRFSLPNPLTCQIQGEKRLVPPPYRKRPKNLWVFIIYLFLWYRKLNQSLLTEIYSQSFGGGRISLFLNLYSPALASQAAGITNMHYHIYHTWLWWTSFKSHRSFSRYLHTHTRFSLRLWISGSESFISPYDG